MNSSCTHLALTRLARITFNSLIICLAITFRVALFISTKNIFGFCPSFNLKAFQRQQLYEICPYMGSFIIVQCVYTPTHSAFDLSCSKVRLNIYDPMYSSFRPPFLSMKSIISSLYHDSVYAAWSCLGDIIISLLFDTQWITTSNIVFGNCGGLPVTLLHTGPPKSLAGYLMPHLPCNLAYQISLVHVFENNPTHCHWICSALLKSSNGRQSRSVTEPSATAVSHGIGPSRSCFKWFHPQIKNPCFFSCNQATHSSFHSLNTLW